MEINPQWNLPVSMEYVEPSPIDYSDLSLLDYSE